MATTHVKGKAIKKEPNRVGSLREKETESANAATEIRENRTRKGNGARALFVRVTAVVYDWTLPCG